MIVKSINKSVAAVLTPEPMAESHTPVSGIKIKARTTNTQVVYIGGPDAQLYPLGPGQELDLSQLMQGISKGQSAVDLAQVWVKVSVNGEGVGAVYLVRPAS